ILSVFCNIQNVDCKDSFAFQKVRTIAANANACISSLYRLVKFHLPYRLNLPSKRMQYFPRAELDNVDWLLVRRSEEIGKKEVAIFTAIDRGGKELLVSSVVDGEDSSVRLGKPWREFLAEINRKGLAEKVKTITNRHLHPSDLSELNLPTIHFHFFTPWKSYFVRWDGIDSIVYSGNLGEHPSPEDKKIWLSDKEELENCGLQHVTYIPSFVYFDVITKKPKKWANAISPHIRHGRDY
ncbi:MAG: hypothetical protein JWQ35_2319, partial [Bacteriovoracaceae bacterium]|nr:hypothetical protein [Bacteriovoracaceae bacterium]